MIPVTAAGDIVRMHLVAQLLAQVAYNPAGAAAAAAGGRRSKLVEGVVEASQVDTTAAREGPSRVVDQAHYFQQQPSNSSVLIVVVDAVVAVAECHRKVAAGVPTVSVLSAAVVASGISEPSHHVIPSHSDPGQYQQDLGLSCV